MMLQIPRMMMLTLNHHPLVNTLVALPEGEIHHCFKIFHILLKDLQVRLMEEISTMWDIDGYVNAIHPLAFAARVNALDAPTYHQVMNRPDAELFVKATEEEMEAMYGLNAWEVIDQIDVPYTAEGIQQVIIESTWAFRIKRFPDGSVKKHRARLCVRGDQQGEGVDCFETYTPVASWSTATLPENKEVCMSLPQGWKQPEK
eukprot:8383060-Ditylum_brightwellii.AAC.1